MFASSLAWLVLKLGEDVPIAPWRLLFLLEGFPAVLVAVVAWDAVVDPSPSIVTFPLASAVGYLVLALARPLGIDPVRRHLAVGFFNTIVLVVAWSINNQPSCRSWASAGPSSARGSTRSVTRLTSSRACGRVQAIWPAWPWFSASSCHATAVD